ncbi:hypothetical protein VNI00_009669 [Paramarasmius palmivorus]|uniref:DUF985 domain-containing protein n=1 Tax=Paramarasmius palmivorus TaxID=297713 RepID=A0AAW0CQF2_9AGAR
MSDTQALIKELGLQQHPAGGTVSSIVAIKRSLTVAPRCRWKVAFQGSKKEAENDTCTDAAPRALATTIYYLLTKESPTGIILREKSVAYHMHHQGRMEYTLITSIPGQPPKIEKKVLGPENRLIVVEPGVWKFARLLPEDLKDEEKAKQGCLMTMLLVPGFSLDDHEFLTKETLEELFKGVEGGEEKIKEFEAHVWKN